MSVYVLHAPECSHDAGGVDKMECQCLRIGVKNPKKSSHFWRTLFSHGIKYVSSFTARIIKMSLFLMLGQRQGRNGLFENRRGRFFGVNLKPGWNDDALI